MELLIRVESFNLLGGRVTLQNH